MEPEYTFWLSIELGNEAMRTPSDVARALRKLSDKLDTMTEDMIYSDEDCQILDDNGNVVGEFDLHLR